MLALFTHPIRMRLGRGSSMVRGCDTISNPLEPQPNCMCKWRYYNVEFYPFIVIDTTSAGAINSDWRYQFRRTDKILRLTDKILRLMDKILWLTNKILCLCDYIFTQMENIFCSSKHMVKLSNHDMIHKTINK